MPEPPVSGVFVEAKVSRAKEGLLLSGDIPPGIANAESVEIFPLRDGAYIVLAKGLLENAEQGRRPAPRIAGHEAALLKKLLSIRFENRVPPEVDRTLSQEEKETLGSLIKKRLVTVFHGQKYGGSGVYNVSDEAFSLVREAPASHASQASHASFGPGEKLEREGFAVVESEGEARALGNAFAEKVKNGEVAGLRSFDRKYYFLKKSYVDQNSGNVISCLGKTGKSDMEVSREANLPLEGCRAILLHLCETGEALERAAGKFARA